MGLICSRNIRLSTLGSLNNICTVAIPGQIVARQCSWKAVNLSHRLQSPHSKPQPGHFNNSTTRRPRSEKPLQTSGSRTIVSCSCFSIISQEAVSRSAALLLLRIKALALQKRLLFVLFELAERTAAILDVTILCPVEVAQCEKGNYLKRLFSWFPRPLLTMITMNLSYQLS